MKKKRVAILMHEDFDKIPEWYFVNLMAKYWQDDGHEVEFLLGTERYVPADLLFVHVDLSVVPDSYLTFAEQYPIVINGRVKDIRKSTFSEGILKPSDDWDGRVIVKSDHNYAGAPELRHGSKGITGKIKSKLQSTVNQFNLELMSPSMERPCDYRVYDNLKDVPRLYFYNPGLIVQKFTPEIEDDLYCIRFLFFLGDFMNCARLKSNHPIVNSRDIQALEPSIEPHQEIVVLREKYNFDYGKFDYVVVDNEPVLLDINKTVGRPHPDKNATKEVNKGLRDFAAGLYSYF